MFALIAAIGLLVVAVIAIFLTTAVYFSLDKTDRTPFRGAMLAGIGITLILIATIHFVQAIQPN